MTEKNLYQQVVDELHSESLDAALWAMVWTKAQGDENKAKAAYVERRVAELKSQGKRAKKREILESWRREWRMFRNDFPWWTCFMLVAGNAFHAFWCFHNPADTGYVALLGAIAGFNILPVLACIIALWFLRRQPRRALEATSRTLLGVTAALLLLNFIDTWQQWHYEMQYVYPAQLANGKSVLLATNVELTAKQFALEVAYFSNQWEQVEKEHAKAEIDAQVGGGQYWANQFWEGFKTPLLNAKRPFFHKADGIALRLPGPSDQSAE